MIIPDTMPTTLPEMVSLLEPLKTNGIFDSITYDDSVSPAVVRCSKSNVEYLQIFSYEGAGFTFTIVIPDAYGGSFSHSLYAIENAAVCKFGAYFYYGGSSYFRRFVIARSHSGKPAFICASDFPTLSLMQAQNPGSYPSTHIGMHVRSHDDNPDLTLYKYGYFTAVMCNSAQPDKTYLQYIPISGERGSTDYFETVFIRVIPQYYEDGEQIIDGKKYGCIDVFAFTDD